MIKNRTAQIIYQTIYCTLGVVGCVACFGVFDNINMIRWDFYVHFTNISNYLCIGMMFAALIQTVKKKEDSYVTTAPLLKFISMLGILLTFVIFNISLADAPDRDPLLNWRVGSICFHIVLPLMYIADWFLFYERNKAKWYYPIASVSIPLLYCIFILVHAALWKFDVSILIPGTNTPLIYPYYFFDLETYGVGGVAKWMAILLTDYVLAGIVFLLLDKILKRKRA